MASNGHDIPPSVVKTRAPEVKEYPWRLVIRHNYVEDCIRKRSKPRPILRVPVEILGEIFKYTVNGHLDIFTKAEVVKLCLVCKHWNDTAHATRQLWARVSVTVAKRFVRFASLKKIKVWLNRAVGVPRSLELILLEDAPAPWETVPVTELLTDGPSLHHLSVIYSDTGHLNSIIDSLCTPGSRQLTNRPWDSIESVALLFTGQAVDTDDAGNPVVEWYDSEATFIFDNLPGSVTHLEVDFPETAKLRRHNRGYEEWQQWLSLPGIPTPLLQKLTSLTITYDWGKTRILSLLESCVNLENLSIEVSRYCGWDLEQPEFDQVNKRLIQQGVHLPQLRWFCLKGLSYSLDKIFEFIVAPSLVSLELHKPLDYYTHFPMELLSFLQRRSRHDAVLRHLTIKDWEFDEPEELPSLLSEIPNLEDLTQLSLLGVRIRSWEAPSVTKAVEPLSLPIYVEIVEFFRDGWEDY